MVGVFIVTIVLCVTVHYLMHRIEFVCWFSARFWDIHDYLGDAGGDGMPSHFYDYHCWRCGQKFNI